MEPGSESEAESETESGTEAATGAEAVSESEVTRGVLGCLSMFELAAVLGGLEGEPWAPFLAVLGPWGPCARLREGHQCRAETVRVEVECPGVLDLLLGAG